MFRKFFIRDRMVMAGLIILGIVTVAAGFVSGRSTFRYALSTDARQASMQWVERAENRLFRQQRKDIGFLANQQVIVTAPKELSRLQAAARAGGLEDLRVARSVHEEAGLLAGIDMLLSEWIAQITSILDSGHHVSRVENFALLEPSGAVVLRSAGFDPLALQSLLADTVFQAELHKAMGLYATRVIDDFAMPGGVPDEFRKALIMPLIKDQHIERIYLVEVDQSSAATVSKTSLIAASVMTSLLIVLGYSVPAAIAFRRIRERWDAEDQLKFLALHDPLTGLPNRVQLHERLKHALARARRRDMFLTIMCIDLDRFKEVNDTLGHKAGDTLLREVASRLRGCVRETDVIARLGGDEFVLVAEDLAEPTDAIHLARRICQQLAQPFDIESHTLAISGSVGITFAPTEGTDTETLLNNADLALYRAKNDGRNTFRFFEPEMDSALQRRRALARDLRLALRNGTLHIHYQPQFELASGALTGYEALARWTHAEYGDIPPSQFIPIAEEHGLIGMLGEWVLETACAYARNWPGNLKLSVNISPAQLVANDLAATVRAVLADTGFPASRLLLEFTEDVLFRDTAETVKTLKELTGMGVLLALDDFGTGYSSLRYLTRLPVSKIKIDQSFTRQMDADPDIRAVVNTIIGIGRSLEVTVAAEGVESEIQARSLRAAGCSEVQGFLYGRPARRIRDDDEHLARLRSQIGTGWPGHVAHGQDETNEPVEIETGFYDGAEADGLVSELAQLLPLEPNFPDDPPRRGTPVDDETEERRVSKKSQAEVTPLRKAMPG